MARVSFSDVLEQESDRVIDSLFQSFPEISSFEEFDERFREFFNTPNGQNAMINSDDIITLFNSNEAKNRIRENVTQEEFEDIYGDGEVIERFPITEKKVATVTYTKIPVHSHTRDGRPVTAYSKGYKKWSNAQQNFLRQRLSLSPKQIVTEYNTHFKKEPRTPSSIKTKFSREQKSFKEA